ncbi:hypothetical protein RHGRI_036347 [Rhododendron griersonianum]|uniref:Uncharacterized protein n=1 Tax=Rhododendron griersonianum TaxID=479676 RepID=A0AAV6HMR2_9ERIC|nr:hypothetical protein RHGRI_036347 [Rhododendron griersonianum]
MATSDLCPRCNTCSENTIHLFRECNKAKELWSCIPSSHLMRGDMDTSNCEWISLNMRSKGDIKLNTDGCWYEANGRGGFGGLFRDHNGDWIMGYYGKGAFTSSLESTQGLGNYIGEETREREDRIGFPQCCEPDQRRQFKLTPPKRDDK